MGIESKKRFFVYVDTLIAGDILGKA